MNGAAAPPQTVDTGGTRTRAPMELAAAARRRTQGRTWAVEVTPEGVAALGT